MTADFAAVFAVLKPVLAKYAKRLSVKTDTPIEYTLLSKSASPFHQHKGEPSAPCIWERPSELSPDAAVYVPRPDEKHLAGAEEANAG
jgi:hypothetical protein